MLALTPNKRWTNKGVYVKLGMQKLVSRKMCKLCKDLQKHIVVEVDGKKIELPPIEGIIILNILRYVARAENKRAKDVQSLQWATMMARGIFHHFET